VKNMIAIKLISIVKYSFHPLTVVLRHVLGLGLGLFRIGFGEAAMGNIPV
jgi:hypothetical protein